jgi:hypothetical protein
MQEKSFRELLQKVSSLEYIFVFFEITGSANLKAMKPLRSSKSRSKNRLDELTSAIKTNGGTILKNISVIEKDELANVWKMHEQFAAHLAIQVKTQNYHGGTVKYSRVLTES